VEMIVCEGKAVCAITYHLDPDGPEGKLIGVAVHAIFVDDKFIKFIPWGTTPEDVPCFFGRSRAGPMKVGDRVRLMRALEAAPVAIEDLRREATSTFAVPEQSDWGLTAAMLVLSPVLAVLAAQAPKAPTDDDHLRNAALRDQFNAARLDIGMTQAEVEAVLEAKPLEAGNVDAGSYKIYGSDKSFNVDFWLHYSNVLVVFREGRVTVVNSIDARAGWRSALGRTFDDLARPAAK